VGDWDVYEDKDVPLLSAEHLKKNANFCSHENTERMKERLRIKLITKYNNYFEHWKDYVRLNAILAFIGLALSITNWERSFVTLRVAAAANDQYPYNGDDYVIFTVVMCLNAVNVLVCFVMEYTA
jgi:hypothetical protein